MILLSTGIFLWEEPDGTRNWAAFACEDELKQLLSELFKRGAASIAEFPQTIIALVVCFGNFLSDPAVCPACRWVS